MGEEEQRCKSEEGGEKRAEGKTEGMQRGESGGRGGRHARSQMSGLIDPGIPRDKPGRGTCGKMEEINNFQRDSWPAATLVPFRQALKLGEELIS